MVPRNLSNFFRRVEMLSYMRQYEVQKAIKEKKDLQRYYRNRDYDRYIRHFLASLEKK